MVLNIITLNFLLSLAPLGNNDEIQNSSVEEQIEAGHELMEQVFHRFHTNYEMDRTHKLGYYQEAMEDDTSVHYLAESILDIYVPSNLNEAEHASVKPIKARKKVYEVIEEENMLFGNASDMARCSIWRPDSFLNDKKRDNYTYQYLKDSLFHNQKVAVIRFTPANSKGNVHGTILVDKHSHAVLHIDYTPDATGSKLWSEVTWTEEFRYKEGRYELSKVKFEGLCSKNTYKYSATLIMQQMKVLKEIPESEHYLDKDGSLFDHAKEENEEKFWNNYFDLRMEVESEDVVHLASK